MLSFLESVKDYLTPDYALGTGAGGAAVWLLWKKFLVRNSEEEKTLVTTKAQIEVINQLREEVNRLGMTNTKLAEELNKLQAENIKLKGEIAQLHIALINVKKEIEDFNFKKKGDKS